MPKKSKAVSRSDYTDKMKEEGFVKQIMICTYPAWGVREGGKKPELQGWASVTQEEFDNGWIDGEPKMGFWDSLVDGATPGQTYCFNYHPQRNTIRGYNAYLGQFSGESYVRDWRVLRDTFRAELEEERLREVDRKDDPLEEHFKALRNEFDRRYGAAKRAFLSRVIWEIMAR